MPGCHRESDNVIMSSLVEKQPTFNNTVPIPYFFAGNG